MNDFHRWLKAQAARPLCEAAEDVDPRKVARAKEELSTAESRVAELTKFRDRALAESQKHEALHRKAEANVDGIQRQLDELEKTKARLQNEMTTARAQGGKDYFSWKSWDKQYQTTVPQLKGWTTDLERAKKALAAAQRGE